MRSPSLSLLLPIAALCVAVVATTVSAQSAEELSTLEQLASRAGLTTLLASFNLIGNQSQLASLGAVTVLAPTNAAFEALGEHILFGLKQSYNSDILAQIIRYHVIRKPLLIYDLIGLIGKTTPETLLGPGIPVTQQSGNLLLGGAGIVIPNLPFMNGQAPSVAHVIDHVILPPGVHPPNTIIQTIAALNSEGKFEILYKALTEFGNGYFTDLLNTFPKLGITLFAPSDNAFSKLPAALRTFPMNAKNKATLYKILRYHIVQRVVRGKNFRELGTLSALNGKRIKVKANKRIGIILNGGTKVVKANIRCANGVIQVVDHVLLPYPGA